MLVLGLTGGVGVGKTAVGKQLESHGCCLISLDSIASTLMKEGSSVFEEIAARWPQVIREGHLDKASFASLIFADPDILDHVNTIVHPQAWKLADEEVKAAESAGWDVAIVESALLLGSIRERSYDANILVLADDETRIKRLVECRKMRREDALARIARQASAEEMIAIADYVMENSTSDTQELAKAVTHMWREWITPLAERVNSAGLSWVERANLDT